MKKTEDPIIATSSSKNLILNHSGKLILVVFVIALSFLFFINPYHVDNKKQKKIVKKAETTEVKIFSNYDSVFTGKILSGQSFYTLTNKYNVSNKQAIAFYNKFKDLKYKYFMPGDSFIIAKKNNTIQGFSVRNHNRQWLCVEKNGDSIYHYVREPDYHIELGRISGTLNGSLYESIRKLGQKPELIMKFSDIFVWDINFFCEPQKGDSFFIVFEKIYEREEFVKYGRILAANYKTKYRNIEAFLFSEDGEEAYFDSDGNSLKKMFLKAPLNYTRISSRFTLRRYHPVLHKYRAHLAVDYAAPTGTPVYAAADGYVKYAKWCGGYGKCVCIKHGNGFKTYYGHLSRYGKGIRKGVKVKQRQFIGYVGRTGLATGPHLDFRVESNGRYINPLTIKSPKSLRVKKKNKELFMALVILRKAQLNGEMLNESTMVCQNKIKPKSKS